MAKYSETLKSKAMKCILKGQSIEKISKDLCISITTLYRWKKYFINQCICNNCPDKTRKNNLKSELTLNIKIYS
jgi:transposase